MLGCWAVVRWPGVECPRCPVDKEAIRRKDCVRNIARQVQEDLRPRFVSEAMDVVSTTASGSRMPPSILPVMNNINMLGNGLLVLESDKEGFLVVLDQGKYNEKAQAAVENNFSCVSENAERIRKQAVSLLNDARLDYLVKDIKKAKEKTLGIFFSVKTHKLDMPFRSIVSERNTWQSVVSSYLQKNLSCLKLEDPYFISSSSCLVQHLEMQSLKGCAALSVDVEDLFFSLPHNELMESVKICISQFNDVFQLRARSGVSLESFLKILSMYLKSTVIGWQDKVLRQKSGVCIGSKVPPVLSDIFLSRINRKLSRGLGDGIRHVCRYVDDYLVIFDNNHDYHQMTDSIIKCFQECGYGLRFTTEFMEQQQLQ
ncbi:uncharacterized protein LOC125757761 [Rhipicephalus sanguineus]|uniref:uncharacterized protein LOC125757761 n=1 Tax=Rhipicephalus sanguineus TaxID=34632 RepID=UPI0020C4AEA9|nr:uncharacterized protein LOC125757761 [Rhipicephalus sanguineus]